MQNIQNMHNEHTSKYLKKIQNIYGLLPDIIFKCAGYVTPKHAIKYSHENSSKDPKRNKVFLVHRGSIWNMNKMQNSI